MSKKYLKTSEIASFASSAFGRSMIYTLMSTYLLIFYTDAAGIDPVHAGWIIFGARIFDAANDPLMGMIADRTKTKFGKLRPYLLFSPFLIMAATIALFTVPNFESYGAKVAYATITYVIWGICFTIQDVPFWGMSAVVTPLENERNKFISIARIGSTIGGILPTVLIPVLRTSSLGITKGYFVGGLIFGVVGSMISLLAFFGTKERVEQPPKEKVTFKEVVSAYAKNKPLLLLIVASVLGSAMLMAQTSGSYIAVYLIEDGMSGIVPHNSVQLVMTVAIGAGMMIAMVLMPILRKKFSLKQIYIGSALFGAVMHVVLFFMGYDKFYALLVVLAVIGLPLGIFNVITYAMVGDSVDYLEWKTGRRSEGICFASQTFISKLTAGISTLITGFVLRICKYAKPLPGKNEFGVSIDIPQDQPDSALIGMFIMITLIPAVSLALCAIPMFFNNYTGKKKEEIIKELEARRENSNVNK